MFFTAQLDEPQQPEPVVDPLLCSIKLIEPTV